MKIRMKVDLSGTYNGEPWPARGGVADVPDAIGAKMCAGDLAVPVAVADVETAAAPTGDVEQRDEPTPAAPEAVPLTTESGPVKRGPGRPRKNQS